MFALHNVGSRSLNLFVKFSVGGYFLGTGGNKAYVNANSVVMMIFMLTLGQIFSWIIWLKR